jgi:hypothetical protein
MTTQLPLFHPPKTRETLPNDIWRAWDILRRDNNCGGGREYAQHPSGINRVPVEELGAPIFAWQT